MNKIWFSIEAKGKGGSTPADIYIFDSIGEFGISARRFIGLLKSLDAKQINLHINSPGGNVFDGIAIQNVLKNHKANVTVFIDGLAASIASIIALAADDIRIADNAYVMIHNPTSIVYGEAKDMEKEAELLEMVADGMAGDYSRKMDITVGAARELMDAETWYLGQEAVEAGFADATYEGAKVAASFDVKRFARKAPDDVLKRFSRVKKSTPQKQNQKEITHMARSKYLDIDAKVKAALGEDRKRQSEISAIGKKFGFEKKAEEYAFDGNSVEEFHEYILNKSPEDLRASLATQHPDKQFDGAVAVEKIKARRTAQFCTK